MMIPDIFNCHSPLEKADMNNNIPHLLNAESRKTSELVFTILDTTKYVLNVYKTHQFTIGMCVLL